VETDEQLDTGYGPSTPAHDNVLNDFARGESRGYSSLATARGERIYRDEALGLTLPDGGSPTPFGNTAFTERPLSETEWAAAAAVMHDFFAGHPGGPFMLFSAWPTPDLREHDFGLVGHPPMMWRAAGPCPQLAIRGLEIRAVTDPETAAVWEETFVFAYPVPEVQSSFAGALLPAPALDAPGWHHWLGLLDGRPVATSSAFEDGIQQHVELISTLPECRGRGVGAAMTIAATQHDTLPATLIASDPGRPVYERLGYVSIVRYTLWAGHRKN
jgi:GNAT superfamily N-acetyltransferase